MKEVYIRWNQQKTMDGFWAKAFARSIGSSQARHIQVNISSRGVAPDLFMPSPRGSWEKSASCLVQLAEMYPETLFLVPVFQPFGDVFGDSHRIWETD